MAQRKSSHLTRYKQHHSNKQPQTNPTIDVTPPSDRTEAIISALTRRITITVAVPRVQILTIAHLDLQTPVPSPAFTPPIAPLGMPLQATLHIKHTRKWDEPSTLAKAANLADPNDPVPFVYEVDADPNVWLLGGARRVQFEAREGEVRSFPLTLIPLREGYPRWLPSVSVRPAVKDDEREGSRDRSAAAASEISCELDLVSQHACVQVVPDWKSVTVGVGVFGSESGGEKAGSEAVLLEVGDREDLVAGVGEEGSEVEREGVVLGMGLPVEFRDAKGVEKVAEGGETAGEGEAAAEDVAAGGNEGPDDED